MKFVELPLPVDERTPDGFRLVVAYAKGPKVFLPIHEMPENDDHHNCDWEGCGSIEHVASIDFEQKYINEEAAARSANNLQAAIAENLKDYSMRLQAGHKQVSCEHVVGMLTVLSQLSACK